MDEGHVGWTQCSSNCCHPLVPRRTNRVEAESAGLHVPSGTVEVPAEHLCFEQRYEFASRELCIVKRRCTNPLREVALSNSSQEVVMDDLDPVHAAI